MQHKYSKDLKVGVSFGPNSTALHTLEIRKSTLQSKHNAQLTVWTLSYFCPDSQIQHKGLEFHFKFKQAQLTGSCNITREIYIAVSRKVWYQVDRVRVIKISLDCYNKSRVTLLLVLRQLAKISKQWLVYKVVQVHILKRWQIWIMLYVNRKPHIYNMFRLI